MAFPASPTVGQTYDKWTWNGVGWEQTVVAGGGNPIAWQPIVLVHAASAVALNPLWSQFTYV